MMNRRNLPSFAYFLLIAASCTIHPVSSQGFEQQQPPEQPQGPLGDVVYQILDRDKDGKVTWSEVEYQMFVLEMMFPNPGAAGTPEAQAQAQNAKRLFQGVKAAAPKIFALLDRTQEKVLVKEELAYVTEFEKSLAEGGGMGDLVRDVFALLDSNSDDQLSVKELLEGSQSDGVIAEVSVKLHKLFPLRKTPGGLKEFVKSTIKSIVGGTLDEESIKKGISWIDDNGDGYIDRKVRSYCYTNVKYDACSCKLLNFLCRRLKSTTTLQGINSPSFPRLLSRWLP